ncbi:MAG: hypothetical protein MK096_00885 [Oleiphilaceae bacterium]|nr:hypothetical protein [Oleiphilaceae bacterium]
MKKLGLSVAIVSALTLSACGGGSSSAPAGSGGSVSTGVFLDSAVANIGYRTDTQSGVTNDNGEYNYLSGETVTFFIGDLELPAVEATGVVTPLTIAGTQDTSDDTVVNITRLLQSLDTDGDPDNGIEIADEASDVATAVDFTQSITDFANSTAVTTLVANSGSTTTALISEDQAISHLEETLIEEGETFTPSSSIAGIWTTDDDENDLLAFVFFQDGTYVHMEVDIDDASETNGMEWGTYSRNDETGLLELGITFDNTDTGLFDFSAADPANIFAQVDDDVLTLEFDDNNNGTIDEDESLDLTRSANSDILGAWTNTSTENELLAFVFFDNGTYAHLEVDEEAPNNPENPDEVSGMEWGTYSINSENDALTASITFDGNLDTGLTDTLSESIPLFAKVEGDTLTLQFDEDESGVISSEEELVLNRAPMPVYEKLSN